METYLCYINKMGVNYKGENLYEFIFTNKSNLPLVDGESWDKTPADGFPSPPSPNFINEITLNVIQDSNFFGVYDAVDNIIALGWENLEEDFEGMENVKRLVFHYGENSQSVADKLYSRDIILERTKSNNLEIK